LAAERPAASPLDTGFSICEHREVASGPFAITYKTSALKALSRMQPAKARNVMEALAAIAADPFARHPNVKPLKGIKSAYRARVGDLRASYTLHRGERLMNIFEIAPRGGAYR
jgi:mRNA-degrading endonuclease RelE of RelBE toxin-antitoxin system